MDNMVKAAYTVARAAHEGQLDKAGRPYINHPLMVARNVVTDTEKAVALLHDVVEDSSYSLDNLADYGFPAAVVDAVDCMTKRQGEPYEVYLSRVKNNPLARLVKIADMQHNCDITRIPNPTAQDYTRIKKYELGLQILQHN